jgi:HK97 family phage portal protein
VARFRLWPRRAANRDLYSGQGYALVPRLDLKTRVQTPIETALKENPLALGPLWGLSFRMGALPIKVHRIDPDTGERRDAQNHPGYTILRKPNDKLTRSLLVSGTVFQMLGYESAMWYKARPIAGGPPGELWPLAPGTFSIKTSKRGLIEGVELRLAGGERETIPFEDVCYFRLLPNPTDWASGISPFPALAGVVDLGKIAIAAASDFFDQGTLGTKWIKTQQALSQDALYRFKNNIEAQRKRKYDWPVLEEDFELKDAGTPPSDEVLVSTMDNVSKVVKDALGIPLDGDLKRLYAEVVQPIADAIEQELERSLFSEWPNDPAFPEFGFREILKGDPVERSKLHQTNVYSAGETPNEARKAEDLPPLPGGDQLFVPLNLVPIGSAGEPETPTKDSSDGLGGDQGKGTLASVRSLRTAEAWGKLRERVLKRHGEVLWERIDRALGHEQRELGILLDSNAPAMSEVKEVLRRTDAGVEKHLRGMMMETAGLAWHESLGMVGAEEEELPQRVEAQIAERAGGVASAFGEHRLESVTKAIGGKLSGDGDIEQVYERFSTQAPVIARTETAFAFDLAGTQELSGVQSGA